jgi:hypothetical protein
LKAVLEEGNAPTDEDNLPQRLILKFQVPVPGNGHEDVGADEKNNCPHGEYFDAAGRRPLCTGAQ